MKKTLIAFAITAMASTYAAAQDIQFAAFNDVESAFASQQAEIEQLRGQLASFQDMMADPALEPGAVDAGACCCCVVSYCGVTFEAELLMLSWYNSDGGDDFLDSLEHGSRWTLGHTNECGQSFRIRYFEWKATENGGGEDLLIETLDFEYAQRISLNCNLHAEFSGGVRWASWHETQAGFLIRDSIGPMVGIDVRNNLCGCMNLYGVAHYSHQFGEASGPDDDFVSFGIIEVQIGVESSTCVFGTHSTIRAGYVAQNYLGLGDDSDEDYGLHGLLFSVQLYR